MKHKRLAAAVLAAAVVLAGCGSATAPAAPTGSGTVPQSTADTAVQTAQKDRITDQFTLEKTIQLYELSLIHISEPTRRSYISYAALASSISTLSVSYTHLTLPTICSV